MRAAPERGRASKRLHEAFPPPRSLREHRDHVPGSGELHRGLDRLRVRLSAADGERAGPVQDEREREPVQLRLRHEPQKAPSARAAARAATGRSWTCGCMPGRNRPRRECSRARARVTGRPRPESASSVRQPRCRCELASRYGESMAKTLVVAEKPSVGRDLSSALAGKFEKDDGYLESDDYVITFAVGHLVQLDDPEAYDEKFKKWRMDDLPIVPEELRARAARREVEEAAQAIHKLMKRDDVDRIINACDAGREGELIFAYIYELVRRRQARRPRSGSRSMTKQAIREGFEKLRPGEQMRALEAAARSRSEADWLVGMNATRAATHSRPRVGRRRRLARPGADADARDDRQARARDPGVRRRAVLARARRPSSRRYQGSGSRATRRASSATPSARRRDRRQGLRQGRRRRVGRAQGAVRERAAPLRPDLAPARREPPLRLQRAPHAAGRAEPLRGQEGDHLPAHVVPLPLRRPRPAAEADRRDAAARSPTTRRRAQFVLALAELPLERVVNDAKVTDHHAIIPTDIEHDVADFSPDERRIFDLVARRFLAVFHPPARYAAHDGRHRGRGASASARAARSRSRPAGAASTASSPDAEKIAARTRRPTSDASCRRSSRARRCAASTPRSRRRRRSRRRATPRRRCSRRWRPPASSIDDEELREAMKESGPRHAGDARGDDRDADPPRVHRARRPRPPADAEGPPGDHDARGAQDHLAGADRRLGAQARPTSSTATATATRSCRRSPASPTRSSSRSRRSTRRSSGPSASSSARARAAAPRPARSSARTRAPTAARAGRAARRPAAAS